MEHRGKYDWWPAYYAKNKDIISAKQRVYRLANREYLLETHRRQYQKVKEQRHEKTVCKCGAVICREWEHKHSKTDKHIRRMTTPAPDPDVAAIAESVIGWVVVEPEPPKEPKKRFRRVRPKEPPRAPAIMPAAPPAADLSVLMLY